MTGLSAAEFGRRAGLSRATVPLLESGENEEPATKTVIALAKASGVPVGWFLTGEGDAPERDAVRSKMGIVDDSEAADEEPTRPKTDPPPPPADEPVAPPKSSPRASEAPELDASGPDPFGGRS